MLNSQVFVGPRCSGKSYFARRNSAVGVIDLDARGNRGISSRTHCEWFHWVNHACRGIAPNHIILLQAGADALASGADDDEICVILIPLEAHLKHMWKRGLGSTELERTFFQREELRFFALSRGIEIFESFDEALERRCNFEIL